MKSEVFQLPVHPWADRFPMRSAEDLESMAASIKANGLRMPIVLGKAVINGSKEPVLCIVDGRNRREACRIAGIEPHTIVLNGEDPNAYIADTNLHRRDLTKGQKAILWAIGNPPRKPGPKGDRPDSVPIPEAVSKQRISAARAVIDYAHALVQKVIDGEIGLDEAYEQAQYQRRFKEADDLARQQLRKDAPDLADKVRDGDMTLFDAQAEQRKRKERERAAFDSAQGLMRQIHDTLSCLSGEQAGEFVRVYNQHEELFRPGLAQELRQWIESLQFILKGIKK